MTEGRTQMTVTQRLSVLVVDDEPILARSVSRFLNRHGFKTDVCHDGYDAIEKAKNATYDVVITDWQTPGVHGYTLLKQLGAINSKCRLVVMTADPSNVISHEAMRASGIPCLPKPFSLDALLQHVRGGSA